MARFLAKLEQNVIKAARQGLQKAAKKTEQVLKQNAGLTDHTLDQLAKLGHPYSIRAPKAIHDPNWLVHRQSGTLQANIKIKPEGEDQIAIGVDPSAVDYYLDVVEGTAKMVPRNFPYHTLKQLEEENVLSNIMETEINKAVKKS